MRGINNNVKFMKHANNARAIRPLKYVHYCSRVVDVYHINISQKVLFNCSVCLK